MAPPSRPFQSQVMTRVMRLYHRLTAKSTQWVRHCQSTTRSWALYPAYVAVQATRSTLQAVQSVTARWRDRLGFNLRGTQPQQPLSLLAADWGIQQVLSAILPATAPNSLAASIQPQHSSTLLPKNHRTLQVQPQQLPTGIQIHGLASCLENRHLVLVSTDNQIVNRLSDDQQAAIAMLIGQLMAAYKHWQPPQPAGHLPTGAIASAHTWRSRPFITWLMGWWQAASVAMQKGGQAEEYNAYLPGQPQWLLLPWTAMPHHFGDRQWVQQGLEALQGWATRWRAVGKSLLPEMSATRSWFKRLSPSADPRLPRLQPSRYHSFQSFCLQSLLPWLSSDKTQLPVVSADLPEVAMPLSMATAGEAIASPGPERYPEEGIPVEVLATEYLERPLRRLLRWLDQLLLWVEQAVQTIWQWCRARR